MFPILAIIAVWVVMELLVDPRGNFPLNDDWGYAQAVNTLISEHTLRFAPVVTMSLAAQVLWGALFCVPFGFSYVALRFSTLTLGLVGLVTAYALLRELGARREIAVIGSLTMAVNPIYFQLSNTFMTDVPFLTFGLLSMYCFVRGLRSDSGAWTWAGVVLACGATLTRQIGIVIPISFGLGWVVKHGPNAKRIGRAALPAIIVGATLVAYHARMQATGRLPARYNAQAGAAQEFLTSGLDNVILSTADIARTALVYVGLFLLPFLIAVSMGGCEMLSRRQRVLHWSAAAVVFIVTMATLISEGRWMPLCGNCLIDVGVGPTTLSGAAVLPILDFPSAPGWFWMAVTLAGAAGGALAFKTVLAAAAGLAARTVSRSDKAVIAMMLASSVLVFACVAVLAKFIYFDRYFLFFMPVLMAPAVLTINPGERARHLRAAVVTAILLAFGVFSTAATHDYLSWNTARWRALNDLLRQGVPSERIDGGYEFNGRYNLRLLPDGAWKLDVAGEYVVTFGQAEGYEEINRYPYRRWIPPGEGSILVLRDEYYRP